MKQWVAISMALLIVTCAWSQPANCRIDFPRTAQRNPGYVALDTFLNQFQLALMLEHRNAVPDTFYTARIVGVKDKKWQKLLISGIYNADKKKYEVTGTYADADQEWAQNQFNELCADSAFNLNPLLLNQNLLFKVKDTTVIQNTVSEEGTDYITICQQEKQKAFYVNGLPVLLEFINKYDIDNKSLLRFKELKSFIEAF